MASRASEFAYARIAARSRFVTLKRNNECDKSFRVAHLATVFSFCCDHKTGGLSLK
jgi:hypothetical protein